MPLHWFKHKTTGEVNMFDPRPSEPYAPDWDPYPPTADTPWYTNRKTNERAQHPRHPNVNPNDWEPDQEPVPAPAPDTTMNTLAVEETIVAAMETPTSPEPFTGGGGDSGGGGATQNW
jgi:hypothetical protein